MSNELKVHNVQTETDFEELPWNEDVYYLASRASRLYQKVLEEREEPIFINDEDEELLLRFRTHIEVMIETSDHLSWEEEREKGREWLSRIYYYLWVESDEEERTYLDIQMDHVAEIFWEDYRDRVKQNPYGENLMEHKDYTVFFLQRIEEAQRRWLARPHQKPMIHATTTVSRYITEDLSLLLAVMLLLFYLFGGEIPQLESYLEILYWARD